MVMGNKVVPKRGFTHNGCFHADDVFATALLLILNPDFNYIRGNRVPDSFDGIVYDIGGGEYDHHNTERKVRENGISYSSFGLLWRDYGRNLLNDDDYNKLDQELVEKIDFHDNNGGEYELSKVIKEMNPVNGDEKDFDDAFSIAVSFAKIILENKIKRLVNEHVSAAIINECIKDSDNGVLIMNEYNPIIKHIGEYTDQVRVCIYPSVRGGYNIQSIRKYGDDDKKFFPEEWCGRSEDELYTITGIPEFVFCHAGGFLGVTNTKDAAISVVRKILGIEKG